MLYCASRLLFALGVQGQAPKVVTKVTRSGVPYVAILIGVRSTVYLLRTFNTSRLFIRAPSLSSPF
jgi:amino acid permease